MKLERSIEQIIKQNEEIELFQNDDILSIVQMITCEVIELNEATHEAFLTDDLMSVVSEVSDCLYLLIRLFNLLEIDDRALQIKIDRNYEKYSGYKDKEQAKADWKSKGGDKAFFEKYIDKE